VHLIKYAVFKFGTTQIFILYAIKVNSYLKLAE